MDFARKAMTWFLSSLVAAAGARCAHYVANRLTQQTAPDPGEMPGSDSRALCPCCGKQMRQFSKTLFCGVCGHRDN